MKKRKVFMLTVLTTLTVTFTACSDEDNSSFTGGVTIAPSKTSFIIASNDATKSLKGGTRVKVYTNLETTWTDQKVYGDSTNAAVVYSPDGFTQAKYNSQNGFFTGFIYRQGSVDESAGGIGSGKMGARTYQLSNGKFTQTGVNIVSNFGNVGVFGNYTYAAMNSDMTVSYFTAAGAMTTWTVPDLTKYAIDGIAPNISDILDMGNNRLAMTLYYSNRDSAAVVFTDYSFSTVSAPVFDERIGGIYGAWRSARYAMGGVADNGMAYVFCGTSSNGSKVGALRIKNDATTLDPDYHFDIFTAGDGYRFRKAYPISGSKFLLEFYIDKTAYSNMSTSGKFAIADMETKTLTWVTGLPAASDMGNYSIGYGDGYDGYYYLPVNPAESRPGKGGAHGNHSHSRAAASVVPTIYKINASTAKATPFMTFSKNESVKTISIIKK